MEKRVLVVVGLVIILALTGMERNIILNKLPSLTL